MKVYYATQIDVNPPTLVLFVNNPELITMEYQRFFVRQLRERLLRRFGRNLTTYGPLLTGAAVASYLNRRATVALAQQIRNDLVVTAPDGLSRWSIAPVADLPVTAAPGPGRPGQPGQLPAGDAGAPQPATPPPVWSGDEN